MILIYFFISMAIFVYLARGMDKQSKEIKDLQLSIQSVRRGLIRERGRFKKRPILRNRELIAVGRTLGDRVPKDTPNIESLRRMQEEMGVEWSGPGALRKRSDR